MIKEIYAKVILNTVKQPDTWFGLKYNMNLYRGCQHQCVYCDSRSACYQIENFNQDVLVKVNAIELLQDELSRKRVRGTIGTGSMNDPYMPLEKRYNLTGRALREIARFRFPVHVITKSDLVLRDLEMLVEINRVYAAVTFTITTTDDALAKKLEPGAPTPSERFAAMEKLAEAGVLTGVTMMPILPHLEDTEENVANIVAQTYASGGEYIIASFGVTLRDRQRLYFYEKLDRHFPGMRQQYEREFGKQYFAPVRDIQKLEMIFRDECARYGIRTQMPFYSRHEGKQLALF